MLRHVLSLRIALIVILAAIVVAHVDLTVRGFVGVHDPEGLARRITLVDPAGERDMHAFARRYVAARPRAEGEISVLCRSGRVVDGGSVAPGRRTMFTVTRQACRA